MILAPCVNSTFPLHPDEARRLLAQYRAQAADPTDWFHAHALRLADALEDAIAEAEREQIMENAA